MFTFTNEGKNKEMNKKNQLIYCKKILRKYKLLYVLVMIVSLLLTITSGVFVYLYGVEKLSLYIYICIILILLSSILTFVDLIIGKKINSIKHFIRHNLEDLS